MSIAGRCLPLLLAALAAGALAADPRSELARVAARAPALADPLGELARAARAAAPAFPRAGRALAEATCEKPFQLVEAGERCTVPTEGQQTRMCKNPLRCITGMCKRVKEGDACSSDAMCDGTATNLDLVCVDRKCARLFEAGEACSLAAQCFSNDCSAGRCAGLAEGASCAYTASGGETKELFYQNPCGHGLHCSLRGMRADGAQDAKCAKAAALGEPCLGFAVPITAEHRTEQPAWFMSAYVSSVYSACAPGHVCEVRGFATEDSTGHGALAYAGTCRLLLHAAAGAECHSDMVCEPPYSCIDSVCAASPAQCGAEAGAPAGADPREADEARRAALLSGCASNEKCSCPEGVGECVAIHDECASDEQRLVKCMERNGCAWIDAGSSQCAEERCQEEDIAFECCKYRGPQFAKNTDWEAMQYTYGLDVLERCSHIVSGTVVGLARRAGRGERVVLELNGKDDQIVAEDGPFAFSLKLRHMDAYNVTISHQPASAASACAVSRSGSGVALDDVHDVLVSCGDGVPRGGRGGGFGAVAAGILLPCLALAGCAAAASVAIGRRNGGGPREGFAVLARGVRDLPRTVNLPAVSLPTFGRGGGGGSADYANSYFAGSGNDYAAGSHMSDPIPEAVVIDAATGLPAQPVMHATVVS